MSDNYTSLDPKTREEWLRLSGHTVLAIAAASPCQANEALSAAALEEPHSPLAPAYRLWMADNLAREGRYTDAVRAFDETIHCAQSAPPFLVDVNPASCALLHKAQAAVAAEDFKLAVATYRDLASVPSETVASLFQ